MASLVKNIPIASFSPRGLLPLFLLVACIAALFFVPDMLKVSRTADTAPVERQVVEPARTETLPAEEASEVPAVEAAAVSPLDSVLDDMNREAAAKASAQAPGQEFSIPGAQPISWDLLRAEPAQAALSKARGEANALLGGISETILEPRQALINMIATVDFVNSDSAKVIPATEAAEQLEVADLNVAAALQDKSLDRTLYLRWMDVSLAPVLQNYRSDRLKQQMMYPFDPVLRLHQVDIAKMTPQAGNGNKIISRLVIYGSVQGNDITRLQLYRNGVFIQEVPFSEPDERGLRHFTLARGQAYGTWVFKAEDNRGGSYEKAYRFFPRIERFPREEFSYILPFDPSEPDPRLDALFRVGERKGPMPSESSALEEF